ncbi:hypothetical protein SUGI_0039870 [Cryptomeria japonica]|nr:hypothetical protein SUGI_0039870 [Cryptomeria japonica]
MAQISESLTRERSKELNMDLFKKIIGPVKRDLEDASLQKTDINEIVLDGGNTCIPKVQQFLKDFFDGKEPNKGVNLDEVVAFGTVVQVGTLSGEGGDQNSGLSLIFNFQNGILQISIFSTSLKSVTLKVF